MTTFGLRGESDTLSQVGLPLRLAIATSDRGRTVGAACLVEGASVAHLVHHGLLLVCIHGPKPVPQLRQQVKKKRIHLAVLGLGVLPPLLLKVCDLLQLLPLELAAAGQ